MTDETATAAQRSDSRDVVALRLPATSAYLSVLRTVTAGLGARLDFTLDQIEDLRIAVDEASGLLLTRPAPETELECRFELNDDSLNVRLTAATVDGNEPPRDSFAWNVLAALAGHVDAQPGPDNRVTITLRKNRDTAEFA